MADGAGPEIDPPEYLHPTTPELDQIEPWERKRMREIQSQLMLQVPLATDRGQDELRRYVTAMSHELKDNAHKGHWLSEEDHNTPDRRPLPDGELLGDLFYHAAKLALAVRSGDKIAIQEYAADVGNCAWFVADKFGALDPSQLHEGPIEYDLDHEGLNIKGEEFANYKRITREWAIELLTQYDEKDLTV